MSVSAGEVAGIITAVTQELEAAKDQLTELDAAVGDGDLGVSIVHAAQAVRAGLPAEPDDVGELLLTAGVAVSDAAGATIGALTSIGLIQAARTVTGRQSVERADAAAMARAAEEGIKKRGGADVGDKTLLDALVPVADALALAVRDDLPAREAADLVLDAAEKGVAATTSMTPRFGRARWLADRSTGHRDPGATVVYLVVRAVLGR